jgi:hypothetical protein
MKKSGSHTAMSAMTVITLFVMTVFIISSAIQLYLNHERKKYEGTTDVTSISSPITEPLSSWDTTVSHTQGFTFRHPKVFNGPATIREDLVEVYDEVSGLVLMMSTIDVPVDPQTWLSTRKQEDFTLKPLTCFSKIMVTDVTSAHDPKKILLHFDTPVLMLDGITSTESRRGSCADFPTARVLLIPHNNKILRITFTDYALSERVLSTVKLTE